MKASSKDCLSKNSDFISAFEVIKRQYENYNLKIEKIKSIYTDGKWSCAELSNGTVGMAFNFSGNHDVYGDLITGFDNNKVSRLVGFDADKALFEILNDEDILMRSFALSILNALSLNLQKNNDYCSFSSVEDLILPNDNVMLIGLNPFMVEKFSELGKNVFISDMRSKEKIAKDVDMSILDQKNIFLVSPNDNKTILEKSDVVVFTGCTLVNKTYIDIIKWSKNARAVAIFGPSAELVPEYLFNLGVTHISTSNYKICKNN